MLKLLPSLLTVALSLPSVINAGVSSFHELQTKLNPSPLDVLDTLDEFETIWVEVHQKSCGKCLYLYVYIVCICCTCSGGGVFKVCSTFYAHLMLTKY